MVPPPQRAAFARKAEWFRFLAQALGKKEAKAASKKEPLSENSPRGSEGSMNLLRSERAGDLASAQRGNGPYRPRCAEGTRTTGTGHQEGMVGATSWPSSAAARSQCSLTHPSDVAAGIET